MGRLSFTAKIWLGCCLGFILGVWISASLGMVCEKLPRNQVFCQWVEVTAQDAKSH